MLKQAETDKTRNYGGMVPSKKLDFIHVPIVDCSTTNDDTIFNLALELVRRFRTGENIYCHCWGGHGRAGTVVSVVLGLLYNLSPAAAMKRCQHFHDQRRARLDVPSPQTDSQRAQVTRILQKYHGERTQMAAIQGLFSIPAFGRYYFYLYATTLTIYFHICYFWLLLKLPGEFSIPAFGRYYYSF
jgi:hypothetical protein